MNAAPAYNRDELTSMTVAQLKELASENGVTLTATRKSDIIDQIMEQ